MDYLIFLWLFLFFMGYIIIYYSADEFVDCLRDLSLLFKISPFLIGLLILGIDPEETIASVVAAIGGLHYIAVGNVIGNSIISISFCFALPALFYKLDFESVPKFYPALLILGNLIILLGYFIPYNLFITGIINLVIFGIYLLKNLAKYRKSRSVDIIIKDEDDDDNGRDNGINDENEKIRENEDNKGEYNYWIESEDILKGESGTGDEITGISEVPKKSMYIGKAILYFLLIVLGGEILIFSAERIIGLTGIKESFFGFIIIAAVTNVEEVLLIIKSIQKKEMDIGIGGMIGKVIWNICFTYGISGIIAVNIVYDISILLNCAILFALLLYFYHLVGKKSMGKKEGIVLMAVFGFFIATNLIAL